MFTFLMTMLTLLTVLGGVILGWLARCYWLGGNCCEMMHSYEATGSAKTHGGLASGAIGTVAAGTAAVRYADDQSDGSSGKAGGDESSTAVGKLDGSDSGSADASGLSGLAAGALGSVAAGAAAVKVAGGKAVAAGTAAARSAGEKVSDAASDARSSLAGSTSGDKADDESGDGKGVGGLAAGALGSVAAGAAAVKAAGGKAVAAGTAAARSAGEKVSDAASDARSSLAGSTSDDKADDGSGDGKGVGVLAAGALGSVAAGAAAVKAAGGKAVAAGTAGARSAGEKVADVASDARSSLAGDKSAAGSGTEDSTSSPTAGTSSAASGTPKTSTTDSDSTGGTPASALSGGKSADAISSGKSDSTSADANDAAKAADLKSGDGRTGTQSDAGSSGSGSAGLAGGTAGVTATGDSAKTSTGTSVGSGVSGDTAKSASAAGPGKSGSGSAGTDAAGSKPSPTTGNGASGAGTAAGVGGAALAGAAVAGADGSSSGEATSDELEASRAEVRGLRKRLGLTGDSDGSDRAGNSVDQNLTASREEARTLRQDLWSKQQAESAENSEADSSDNQGAAAEEDFGALSAEEAEAERLIASGTAPKGPSNGLEAPTPGFDADNLTKIRGIGKPTQGRLNRNGIYYYDQIAGFTAADLAWADKEMNLEGRVVSDRWIPQAKLLSGESGAGGAGGGESDDSAMLVDVPSALSAEEAEAERLLASGEEIAPPASRLDAPRSGQPADDLTRIKGIGPKINGKLNDQGIYYYDQIAGFTGSDLAWADRELEFKGRAVRDRWIPQAKGLMEASSGSQPTAAAPAGLLSKPIEGRDPDDLTAIKGVGNVLQKQLNEKGIYYYEQIAEFTDSDQEWANQTLGFPGRVERDNWIPQARELMHGTAASGGRATRLGILSDAGRELETLSDDEEFGEMSADEVEAMRLIESGEFVADESNRPAELLSSASQGAKDDLKRIKGVGPKLEDLLNSLGIYYFRQVGGFSASDIAWVDSKLRFKGRIVRDRWVDQAKRLS